MKDIYFLILLCLTLAPSSAAFQSIYTRTTRSILSMSKSPSNLEISTLFNILRDTSILYDPSRGTCCRNKCSGCTYLDSDGNFAYDEFTSNEENGGWIAPYTKVDFGEKIHESAWGKLLFGNNNEIEKNDLSYILLEADVSNEAMDALWVTISPSIGYPRLKTNEVIRAIKGIEGSNANMGGAVDYASFHKAMLSSASLGDVVAIIVYDAMEKEELLALCLERGMKTNFPKMKRIIIEELRFFDANGRQGKRHPTKNTLS
ncbi:hypothetical protein ACHAXN_005772 [Cyclotella atomus]